ncbi:MAG: MBL fold metallo-hydrolase [Vicinamibacterales bacterium]
MLRVRRLGAYNPGPMTGSGNHTYLIDRGCGRGLLIDSGVGDPRHLRDLGDALSEWNATLDDVLVTHGHHDHSGGVTAIAAAYPGTAFCKWPWPQKDRQNDVRWRALTETDTFPVNDDGALEVVHTPGHSPDHVALWHGVSATLFCGDLVVPGGSVAIQWSRGGNMSQYFETLRRVIALEPRLLWPAHGPEITEPGLLLTQTLRHRLSREHQVVERLKRSPATVQAIVESIYHGLAPAHEAAAHDTIRAHLEKLRREGLALQRDVEWELSS